MQSHLRLRFRWEAGEIEGEWRHQLYSVVLRATGTLGKKHPHRLRCVRSEGIQKRDSTNMLI